jgi:hypothetical protein
LFGLFKRDPTKRLRQQYEAKMREAMDLQRKGDIPAFAIASGEAEELLKQLEAAEAAKAG